MNKYLRTVIDFAVVLTTIAILIILVNLSLARIKVEGESMVPSLFDGQYVLVNKLVYWLSPPDVGDVVVFRLRASDDRAYVKRVVGRPGDSVEIDLGDVFLNGERLSEDYLWDKSHDDGLWVVPDNSYFVLGDNRSSSYDSRDFHFVPSSNILGKAVFIYWPIQEWGSVHDF